MSARVGFTFPVMKALGVLTALAALCAVPWARHKRRSAEVRGFPGPKAAFPGPKAEAARFPGPKARAPRFPGPKS
ncbi:hypothetical protein WEB32_32200 [Streptomyces netropsis]|uniref:hypothetical protein n=1 Tax=Streptomyces netropsis TaxID=55404 RepID=UPI0030D5EE16